jgi:translocation and assembly module TamA
VRSVFVLAMALIAYAAPPAAIAGVEYRVEVVAPEELAAPLRQGLGLVRWREDPDITPGQLRRLADEAVREARALAAAEGYFSAEARAEIDESSSPWRVTLHLAPGERTRIAEVDLRVVGPAADDVEARERIAAMRKAWSLPRGQPFRQEDWDAAKQGAARALSGWRYAAARVASSEARIDPATREARLSVVLDSGPAYRFGEVSVRGTQRYAPELVANLSPVRPGEDYDRERLIVYQRRLAETGYFASVRADIDTQAPDPAAAPLRVAVIEAPAKQFEAGISYNTDVGPRLQLRYSDHDLAGADWRLRSSLSLDDQIQEVQLDLDSPPGDEGRFNNWFGRARRKDIQNELARTFSLGVAHNVGTDVAPSAVILSWTLEEQQAGSAPVDNRYAVYLGYRRTFRRTDEVIAPRSGYFGGIDLGGAPAALASQDFLRIAAEGSMFFPLGRNGDLALRAQAGRVLADERAGIPTPFLFRTGGDQTVRGYAFESLGVREGDAIVGGRRLLVASAEYTHWLSENWGVAAFVDAGNAWDSGERFRAALGYGVGARLRTPIGPARIDIAYGEETDEFRLHVSIGYVFR